jgi:hypothetical protein
MKRMLSSCALVLVVSMSVAASAQTPQAGCLNDVETQAERVRRQEALQATRLINTVAAQARVLGRYLSWSALAGSSVVATMRTDGGTMGQLARKIAWGTPEPLPGWNMHFVADADAYAFRMRDVRDSCAFAYLSDESGLIWQGPAMGARAGLLPIAPVQ